MRKATVLRKSKAKAPAKPPTAAARIRATAGDLFYRDGIRAVGVEEIVTRAGATKPSLYRAFPSKDELAAAYLRDYDQGFWQRFEAAVAGHENDPRGALLAYMRYAAGRAVNAGYRGCGLTNAAVEYPESGNPARRVAEDAKRAFRERLRAMARAAGARDPDALGDALMLLLEGTFVTSQIFGAKGPARSLAAAAETLIDASLAG